MQKVIKGVIGGVSDSCILRASECLTELCQIIEEDTGEKPSLNDLCELLAASLRECSSDLVSDVDVQAIEELMPKVAHHKKIHLKPGDILSISREMGGYFFVIFITSNRFGDAYGIFEGHRQIACFPPGYTPSPVKHPVYNGRAFVISGRWRRIAHREDLLELFPKSPEMFHSKADNPSNDRIGPFGSGETATGELRDLTEVEAKEIGLIQQTYRQVILEDEFENYLQRILD